MIFKKKNFDKKISKIENTFYLNNNILNKYNFYFFI